MRAALPAQDKRQVYAAMSFCPCCVCYPLHACLFVNLCPAPSFAPSPPLRAVPYPCARHVNMQVCRAFAVSFALYPTAQASAKRTNKRPAIAMRFARKHPLPAHNGPFGFACSHYTSYVNLLRKYNPLSAMQSYCSSAIMAS